MAQDFDEITTIARGSNSGLWDFAIKSVIVLGLLILMYTGFSGQVFSHPLSIAARHPHAMLIAYPALIWTALSLLLLCLRTVLWLRYRPFDLAGADDAPSLTVIIPAYNEGEMVARTIDSVAAARYPAGRLEIIAVDDGSTDDTYSHMERAAQRHPGLVTAIRFSKNRGKKAAMEAGFRKAAGEVAVTIDSDSVIEQGALLAVAGPFRDCSVGAVAGKVVVLNTSDGIIPRMLNVRFIIAFDFIRAAQSTYGTVVCCPGALSAYRTSAVRAALDAWMSQRFLGAECPHGEDRALTNYILAAGYDTVYQNTAVVRTVVPKSYGTLCKMFLRWDRSHVREEIRLIRILWQRPWKSSLMAAAESLISDIGYPIWYSGLGLLAYLSARHPDIALNTLQTIGLASFFYTLYYLRSERSWDFLYGIFYSYLAFFTLFWIFPYATLTMRSKSWLTR